MIKRSWTLVLRCWLIRKLAARDIQVMCNITIRKGCWFVADKHITGNHVTFVGNAWTFETPEMEREFRQLFPENKWRVVP